MHSADLLDSFEENIKEPASQIHPFQTRTDLKIKRFSESVQHQSQVFQPTSSDSDKDDINFTSKQLRFLKGVGKARKKKPNNRRRNQRKRASNVPAWNHNTNRNE